MPLKGWCIPRVQRVVLIYFVLHLQWRYSKPSLPLSVEVRLRAYVFVQIVRREEIYLALCRCSANSVEDGARITAHDYIAERLDEIYARHGYEADILVTETLEGEGGRARIRDCMRIARDTRGKVLLGVTAEEITDYLDGIGDLPRSDSVTFTTDGLTVTVRPSGTEPKIKLYITVMASDRSNAERQVNETIERVKSFILNK